MASLANIRPCISTLPYETQMEMHIAIRNSRRISKKKIKAKKKAVVNKGNQLEKFLMQLSPEELEKLIGGLG